LISFIILFQSSSDCCCNIIVAVAVVVIDDVVAIVSKIKQPNWGMVDSKYSNLFLPVQQGLILITSATIIAL